MSRQQAHLVRRSDGEIVDVEIDSSLIANDLVLIDQSWGLKRLEIFNALQKIEIEGKLFPQSLHWDWTRKASQLKLLEVSGFGVFYDEKWQGAMLTKTASCVSQAAQSRGKPLVYIDYIGAAPWNWNVAPLGIMGELKGTGSLLIHHAVRQSIEEGFAGRLGLHSLPQTEKYYEEQCGMTLFGPDPTKQNLTYFEFTEEEAQQFIDEGGAS